MKKIYLSLIGFLLYLFAYGTTMQVPSSLEYPLTVLKRQIIGKIPSEGTFDLRNMLDDKETSMMIWKDSQEKNIYHAVDDGAVSQYLLRNDTLFLCERQTPLNKIIYKEQEPRWITPICIGTHIRGTIYGEEDYVDKLGLRVKGEYDTSISRSIDVILPDGTHCDNLYLMKTIRSVSYSQVPCDSIGNIPFMEEECYWFLPNDNIPILHSYLIRDVPGSYQAYYYETEQPRDFSRNAVATKDSSSFDGNKKQVADLLQSLEMRNEVEARKITLDFTTLKDMDISIVLSSVSGIVYETKSYKAKANEPISYSYNYSRLHRGEYAIHMDMEGLVKVIKFTVK